MAEAAARMRVLVVDDMAEIRTMVIRVLSRAGFQVDEAATLPEVQTLDLDDYDALLVDARLSDDQGADLVEQLAADDPASAGRCVIMTGGSAQQLPAGVAVLIKPFGPAQLVDAVRAAASGGQAVSAEPDQEARAEACAPRSPPRAALRASWDVVEIIGRTRAYDYGTMADFVHDGPAQELSAALLAVSLIGRSLPGESDSRLEEVDALLGSTAVSLREFSERRLACLTGQLPLAEALVAQTEHLLAEPLVVELAGQVGSTSPAETATICTAVELLLSAVSWPRPRAHVTVSADDRAIEIQLITYPNRILEADLPADHGLAVLGELAGLMGGSAEAAPDNQRWLAHVRLERAAR